MGEVLVGAVIVVLSFFFFRYFVSFDLAKRRGWGAVSVMCCLSLSLIGYCFALDFVRGIRHMFPTQGWILVDS